MAESSAWCCDAAAEFCSNHSSNQAGGSMTIHVGEDILLKALTHRHPGRADGYLNMWFVMLDLSAQETLEAACPCEFVGAPALCCVSQRLAECLRPFQIRCYVCTNIKSTRYFSPRWGHWVRSFFMRRCSTCIVTGEVCLDMHHPNCSRCELDWCQADDSDSSGWSIL